MLAAVVLAMMAGATQIGGNDAGNSTCKAEYEEAYEASSLSRGEQETVDFTLWQIRAVAVVNQPSVEDGAGGVQVVLAGRGQDGGCVDANDSDGSLRGQHGGDRGGDGDGGVLDDYRDPWAVGRWWLRGDGAGGAEGVRGPQDDGREDEGEPGVPDPQPTPTPTPVASSITAGPERAWPGSVQATIQQVFGPQAGTALAVAWCESTMGQDPWAYDPLNPNRGLFQIWKGHLGHALPADTNLWDDDQNIEAAYVLWAEQGWGIWTC